MKLMTLASALAIEGSYAARPVIRIHDVAPCACAPTAMATL